MLPGRGHIHYRVTSGWRSVGVNAAPAVTAQEAWRALLCHSDVGVGNGTGRGILGQTGWSLQRFPGVGGDVITPIAQNDMEEIYDVLVSGQRRVCG